MMCAVETDEVLESGYGPGAPRGDNLLNDFVQGEAEAFAELGTRAATGSSTTTSSH